MRRATGLAFLLSVVLFAPALALTESPLEVHIEGSRFVQSGSDARVALLLINDSAEPFGVSGLLELLDPGDAVIARAQVERKIKPGSSLLRFTLEDLEKELGDDLESLAWYRLRYRIYSSIHGIHEGVFAVGRLAPEAFSLYAMTPEEVPYGGKVRSWLTAFHPFTGKPVPGVRIKIVNDDTERVEATVVTNRDGVALFESEVEANDDDWLEWTAEASKGWFRAEAYIESEAYSERALSVATDRPMYRPGQIVRLRAVLLNTDGTAASGASVEFTVATPEINTVLRTERTTNAFGVVHTEWQIPETAAQGVYEIYAQTTDDDPAEGDDWIAIRVSRYLDPWFTVEAEADRPFYLPGEQAGIEVQARTTDGRAVPGAEVRLHESSSDWERDDDDERGELLGGCTTDISGGCKAVVSLERAHERLGSEHWNRHKDASVLVSVTEPLTGRTHSHELDLRVTTERIHLYADPGTLLASIPVVMSLTAFRADGAPLQAEFVATVSATGGTYPDQRVRLTTDRYGAAPIEFESPAEDVESLEFEIVATTKDGETATLNLTRDVGTDFELRVRAARSLIAPGDPIALHVESTYPDARILVEASVHGRTVYSSVVEVWGHQTVHEIPYDPLFDGEVQIAVLPAGGTPIGDEFEWLGDTTTVLYARGRRLALEASFDRAEARPGERTHATIALKDETGRPVAGSVGALMTDGGMNQVYRERGHSDAESWFRDRSIAALEHAWSGRVGDIALRDLLYLDSSAISDEHQTVAAILLGDRARRWNVEGDSYECSTRHLYAPPALEAARAVIRALEDHEREQAGKIPLNSRAYEEVLDRHGVAIADRIDPWGNPLWVTHVPNRWNIELQLRSSGPDRQRATGDDLHLFGQQWNFMGEASRRVEAAIRLHRERTGKPTHDVEWLRNEIEASDGPFVDPWGTPFELSVQTVGFRGVVRCRSLGVDRRPSRDDQVFESSGISMLRETRAALDEAVRWHVWTTGKEVQSIPELEAALQATGHDPARIMSDPFGTRYKVEMGPLVELPKKLDPNLDEQTRNIVLESSDGVRWTYPQHPWWMVNRARPTGPPHGNGLTLFISTFGDHPVEGASITIASNDGEQIVTESDASGFAYSGPLASGLYTIEIVKDGFNISVYENVEVLAGDVEIDIELHPSEVVERVVVTSNAKGFHPTDSGVQPMSTPRMRRKFAETLLWDPDVRTGITGRTKIDVALADNITTWILQAVAVTPDGRLATASTTLTATQPLRVEPDLPATLTVGDHVVLPVVVRNHGDVADDVEVTLETGFGLSATAPLSARTSVDPGSASRIDFPAVAVDYAEGTPVRITAVGLREGDAVERTLDVRPHGREIFDVHAGLVGDEPIRIPVAVGSDLPGTRLELVLAPGLRAQLQGAVEGMLRMPTGCGEQITSSAWPSLLFLRQAHGAPSARSREARKNLRAAVDQLVSLQVSGGGIPYWSGEEPDLALSGYVLRFLTHASEHVEIEPRALTQLQLWIAKQQRPEGHWAGTRRSMAALTAHTLWSLAIGFDGERQEVRAAMDRAMAYFDRQGESDAYALACRIQAALALGNPDRSRSLAEQLIAAEQSDGRFVTWEASATPFHAWGRGARLETTALVLRALVSAVGDDLDPAVRAGALEYLFDTQDPGGAWYSTQATMQVLETALSLMPDDRSGHDAELAVRLGDRTIKRIVLPAAGSEPIRLDLTETIGPHDGALSLVRYGNPVWATYRLVHRYYEPWTEPVVSSPEADGLAMEVRFEASDVVVNALVRTSVTVRPAPSTRGMLIAEVGLPPGAVVDRSSLELRRGKSGGYGDYEILADRVRLYVRRSTEPVEMNFYFRPRLVGQMHAAPSSLYDYYNPDARISLPPELFQVTGTPVESVAASGSP